MCTVTFLPYNKRNFILTSNRDEDILRSAAMPVQEYTINKRTVFYPKDPKANGTWIAFDTNGYTLCLLNGAHKPHIRKDSYKKSRGLMLLDFYFYNEPEIFAKQYDFSGIEPFTLIMLYSCPNTESIKLYELKWDEKKVELIKHDSSLPQIWSSVTLYSPEVIQERKSWFEHWLRKYSHYTEESILSFHHFGGKGSADNDLIMDRGSKKTVSICCIHKDILDTTIIYEDVLARTIQEEKIILNSDKQTIATI